MQHHSVYLFPKKKIKIEGFDLSMTFPYGGCLILPPYCFGNFVLSSGQYSFLKVALPESSLPKGFGGSPASVLQYIDDVEYMINFLLYHFDASLSDKELFFEKKISFFTHWLSQVAFDDVYNHPERPFCQLLSYVDQTEDYSLSIKDAAEISGLTPAAFEKSFRKEYGMSWSKFLNHQKNVLARYYLKDSRLSVKDIADRLGFCDTAYFIRFFQKNNLVTPGLFRKETAVDTYVD